MRFDMADSGCNLFNYLMSDGIRLAPCESDATKIMTNPFEGNHTITHLPESASVWSVLNDVANISELQYFLVMVDVGVIGYAYVMYGQCVRAGLAGTLAKYKWLALGEYFAAAVEVSLQEHS